mmetsp:Transcript_59422/g.176458  ORF Transcript_59422/g.176458 Transcript_59422/m.176458 type:complete len:222 (-) Transcript_59422:11-676(-)
MHVRHLISRPAALISLCLYTLRVGPKLSCTVRTGVRSRGGQCVHPPSWRAPCQLWLRKASHSPSAAGCARPEGSPPLCVQCSSVSALHGTSEKFSVARISTRDRGMRPTRAAIAIACRSSAFCVYCETSAWKRLRLACVGSTTTQSTNDASHAMKITVLSSVPSVSGRLWLVAVKFGACEYCVLATSCAIATVIPTGTAHSAAKPRPTDQKSRSAVRGGIS